MQTCFIYQPSGIGDILFCQKIAKHYRGLGYKVVWPIYQYFEWLRPYLEDKDIDYPILHNERKILETFDNCDQFFYLMGSVNALFRAPVIAQDFIYLSLGPSTLHVYDMMTSKYKIPNLPFYNWQSYVDIRRNYDREDNLFYNILGLQDNQKYTLINQNSSISSVEIPEFGHTVYMEKIPDDNLFDWIKVIENCSRLITIDTGVVYLAERYLSKNTPCHMISRYKENPTFNDLPQILSLNWQYCLGVHDIVI